MDLRNCKESTSGNVCYNLGGGGKPTHLVLRNCQESSLSQAPTRELRRRSSPRRSSLLCPATIPAATSRYLCGSAMLYSLFTIFLVLSPTAAFSRRLPAAAGASRAAVRMAEDPLANPFIMAINKLQEAIQESPASKLKKGVAKLQAGNYDKIVIQAELNSLMAEPAIMFSFTT